MTVTKGIAELRYLLMEICKVNRYFVAGIQHTLPEIHRMVVFTFTFTLDLYQIKHTEVNPSSPPILAFRCLLSQKILERLGVGHAPHFCTYPLHRSIRRYKYLRIFQHQVCAILANCILKW